MPGIIKAEREPHPERPVQVASIQTLARRDKPAADLVIVDEAHHATAETYKKTLDCYPAAVIIGFTATPCRLSGAPLGDLFTHMVEPIQSAELVERGLLVPVRGFAYDNPRLDKVKKSGGDYANGELAALMDVPKVRGNVVEQYLLRARGSKAIVFAVNVEHSEKLAAEFCAHGIRALHVDGATPREIRKASFEAFRSGAARVLTNCQLFTEGIDLPDIETVILARPTMSLSLALQMIGRGRRILQCDCGLWPHWNRELCECGRPVKKRFVRVHDHASVVRTHGMPDEPRVWSLTETVAQDQRSLAKPGTAIHTCRKCFGVYLADLLECPYCHEPNRAPKRLIRTEQGVPIALEAVEKERAKREEPLKASAETQKKAFFYFLTIERNRHYKRMWAEMRFHGRFKCWPPSKLWRAEFAEQEKAKRAGQLAGQNDFAPATPAPVTPTDPFES
jgi:superfamily II DNA or RNA helicase